MTSLDMQNRYASLGKPLFRFLHLQVLPSISFRGWGGLQTVVNFGISFFSHLPQVIHHFDGFVIQLTPEINYIFCTNYSNKNPHENPHPHEINFLSICRCC